MFSRLDCTNLVIMWPKQTGVSYTGSEIINVHKTKEQREHNKTLFPNPNQNNNGSFVLRHLSPVHESLPILLWDKEEQSRVAK